MSRRLRLGDGSAIAVHWLSERPEAGIDRLWPHPGLGRWRAPFGERARADWQLFMQQRARELRVGGQLVVVAGAARSDGTSTADAYLDVPWEVIGELAREGALSSHERDAMHVPTYFRSADEWRAPFGSELPLELVGCRERLPDAYQRSDDGEAFAAAWVGWLRAFSEPLLGAALHPARTADERRSVLDELYRRTTQRIVEAPERANIPWTLGVVHAVRV